MKAVYHVLPIALSIGLMGCNQATNTNNVESKPASDTTNLKNEFVSSLPASAITLKVATTGTMAPFSFQDEYGNMQGVDIDIIRAIGEEQGFKVNFYKEPWQNLFNSVESGDRDIAISGISYSEERSTKYGLSDSYFFNPSAIMYMDLEKEVKGLDDLQGKKIGVMESTKQQLQTNYLENTEIVKMATPFLLFESLVQRNLEAIVLDQPLLQYSAKSYPEYKVTIVPYEKEDNPAARQVIMLAKDNPLLLEKINEGIVKLKESGEIQKIEEKWLALDAQ